MEEKTMKRISRTEAESMISRLELISTDISQDKDEIRILMNFSEDYRFLMRYSFPDHMKSYYICEP